MATIGEQNIYVEGGLGKTCVYVDNEFIPSIQKVKADHKQTVIDCYLSNNLLKILNSHSNKIIINIDIYNTKTNCSVLSKTYQYDCFSLAGIESSIDGIIKVKLKFFKNPVYTKGG